MLLCTFGKLVMYVNRLFLSRRRRHIYCLFHGLGKTTPVTVFATCATALGWGCVIKAHFTDFLLATARFFAFVLRRIASLFVLRMDGSDARVEDFEFDSLSTSYLRIIPGTMGAI